MVQIFKFSANYIENEESFCNWKKFVLLTHCVPETWSFSHIKDRERHPQKNCCHEPPKYRNLSRKVLPEQKLLNYICFSNRLYLLRKVIFALVFYNLGASAKKIRYHLSDLWPPKLYLTSGWWCINACLLSTESFTQKIHRFLVSLGHPSTLT